MKISTETKNIKDKIFIFENNSRDILLVFFPFTDTDYEKRKNTRERQNKHSILYNNSYIKKKKI